MEQATIKSMERTTIEKLVTARVVALAMGMAQSQVYRLAKSGQVPSYQVGQKKGGVRFDLREVREALRRPAAEGESKAVVCAGK